MEKPPAGPRFEHGTGGSIVTGTLTATVRKVLADFAVCNKTDDVVAMLYVT